MTDQNKDQVEVQENNSETLEQNNQQATPENVLRRNDSMEKTVKMDDIQEDTEYTDDEIDEMVKLYEDTINDFVEGELIKGKILSISDKEVSIDIGFKSEGTVPIEEFVKPEELKIGDDIEVFLDNIEDKEGQLVLSKKKADFMRTWEEVLRKYETNETLQGKCMRRIKGGIVVDLMGIDAFLPGSQIDVKPIRDFDAFIGKTMDFKIVKVNNLRKNIVVSHRVLVEEELVGQRQKILDELHKGQILEGNVKNITDFGVFIDLGGADGLLHINDLSWGRVNHPSEIVALDEKIKVMVLDFNEEKDRISLGLKQLQPHPWENIEQKYPVGSVMKGKVVNISDYGAFVELEKGVEGLIHISEMSWTQHIKHPSKILAVGETVEAKILSVDQANKKISLGLKQLEPDPWDLLEEKYPVGSNHQGKVRNLTNFGAFVELEEGIDGLVHISDLSWTKKVRHPAEVVKKGDTIDVVVLNVDRDNRRISLGFKQVNESPWPDFQEKYKIGAVVEGKIVRLIEKGVIAELNDEVDGFIPLSHLAKPNIQKPSDGYKVGDKLELCVIEFNQEAKKIVCSEKIEYAQSLIRQKQAEGKIEGLVDESIDEDFSIDEYGDSAKSKKSSQKKAKEQKEDKKAPEAKKEETKAAEAKPSGDEEKEKTKDKETEEKATDERPAEPIADEKKESVTEKEAAKETAESAEKKEEAKAEADKDEKEEEKKTAEKETEKKTEAAEGNVEKDEVEKKDDKSQDDKKDTE
ncbi:30S ribosomal protein S1 [candidate division KSB1 bacterium]|nr:30S ribosomal protein S1 [candidate division KSB1 bacterium]